MRIFTPSRIAFVSLIWRHHVSHLQSRHLCCACFLRHWRNRRAARPVALCSGLWSGGRNIEQISADNGGLGGTESMKTEIDYSRKIVSIRCSDAMPPRIVAWRPILGCVQLPIGATEEALHFVPQVAKKVARPDLDAKEWPMERRPHSAGRLGKIYFNPRPGSTRRKRREIWRSILDLWWN
jgi:hypothetical protein